MACSISLGAAGADVAHADEVAVTSSSLGMYLNSGGSNDGGSNSAVTPIADPVADVDANLGIFVTDSSKADGKDNTVTDAYTEGGSIESSTNMGIFLTDGSLKENGEANGESKPAGSNVEVAVESDLGIFLTDGSLKDDGTHNTATKPVNPTGTVDVNLGIFLEDSSVKDDGTQNTDTKPDAPNADVQVETNLGIWLDNSDGVEVKDEEGAGGPSTVLGLRVADSREKAHVVWDVAEPADDAVTWTGDVDQYLLKGDAIAAPADPDAAYHAFTGWSLAIDGVEAGAADPAAVTPEMGKEYVFTAQWEGPALVQFNAGDGTMADGTTKTTTEKCKPGIAASLSFPAVQYADHTLVCWKDDAGRVYPVGAALPATFPAGTTAYTAQWVQDEVNEQQRAVIKFDLAGGTSPAPGAEDPFADRQGPAYFIGATLAEAFPTATPVRQGYLFDGWTMHEYDENGTLQNPADKNKKVSAFPASIASRLTVFEAQWVAGDARIVFEPNGGTLQSGSLTWTGSVDAATGQAMPVLARDGYTFLGWYAAPDFSGSAVSSLSTFTQTGTTTYYAKWAAGESSLWFDLNGGTTGSGSDIPLLANRLVGHTDEAMGAYAWPKSTPVRDGYTFAGWYTNAAGTGGHFVTAYPAAFPMGETTYYAQWLKNDPVDPAHKEGMVVFDFNGLTNVAQTIKGTVGAQIDASGVPDDPVRPGYTFKGWQNTITGNIYADKAAVQGQLDTFEEGVTTYKAVWAQNSYRVSFVDAHGDGSEVAAYPADGSALKFAESADAAVPLHEGAKLQGFVLSGWQAAHGTDAASYKLGDQPTLRELLQAVAGDGDVPGADENDVRTIVLAGIWTPVYNIALPLNDTSHLMLEATDEALVYDAETGDAKLPNKKTIASRTPFPVDVHAASEAQAEAKDGLNRYRIEEVLVKADTAPGSDYWQNHSYSEAVQTKIFFTFAPEKTNVVGEFATPVDFAIESAGKKVATIAAAPLNGERTLNGILSLRYDNAEKQFVPISHEKEHIATITWTAAVAEGGAGMDASKGYVLTLGTATGDGGTTIKEITKFDEAR